VTARHDATAAGRDADRERDIPSRIAWIVVLVVIAGWGAYLAFTLGSIRYAEQADEAWYLRYATEVSTRGVGILPQLFDRYLDHESSQVYPNPLRVLFILFSAAWCAIFGSTYSALSVLSLCCHLATALVTFVAARPSRKRTGLFALALTVALLTKENHVLFAPAFALFLGWLAIRRSVSIPWLWAAAAIGIPMAITAVVFVLAAGGVGPVVKLAGVILSSPAGNEYAVRFGSGPWYRYIVDFLVLSPWVTLAGLGGVAAVLLGRVARGRDLLEFFVVFLVVSLALFGFLTKNVRYLAVLDVAWRGLAVGFVFEAVVLLGARLAVGRAPATGGAPPPDGALALGGAAALGGALALGALACVFDVVTFRTFFLANELYDPISAALLGLRDIVPFRLRR
jgi:hypothetical protein